MQLQEVAPNVYLVQGLAGAATEHEGFISNRGLRRHRRGRGGPRRARLALAGDRMRGLIRTVTTGPW